MHPTAAAVLLGLLGIMLLFDLGSLLQIKTPVDVTVQGKFLCQGSPAYAVLLNLVEEVEYVLDRTGHVGSFRASRYNLSDRQGIYLVQGTRYNPFGRLFLNVSHHCIPYEMREYGRNCLTNVSIKVHNDPTITQFDNGVIELDNIEYQGRYECIDWRFKKPSAVQDVLNKKKRKKQQQII
uniref:Secreted protein n=1 Tax=Parascaris univalens TaxID=6257 RepID=A0A915ALF4_PARUN